MDITYYITEEEKKICDRCCDLICSRHCAVYRKAEERSEQMTDRVKFMEVVKASGMKTYEVAAGLGMSTQSLYNKLGNATEFTQAEIAKFREMFPSIDTKTFNEIFFAH